MSFRAASFLHLCMIAVLLTGTFLQPQPVQAAVPQPAPVEVPLPANPSGDLRIEPITAYNLVVDSNVLSPSTYAPESATLGAQFCNDGSNDMTNVFAYIGDYSGTPTPGIYPSRDSSSAAFIAEHAHLSNTGNYSLTHEGGSAGLNDATRFIGTLAAGECRTEYWLISYPRTNPAGTVSVTGGSIKPDDDLWLNYDFWAIANDGGTPLTADVTTKVTMRNEISAAANKIWPNGDNKVPQQYLDAIAAAFGWDTLTPGGGSTAYPGQLVTTQGIWYDLGNVGFGFDNNGDLVPDHNAWLQPIGIPSAYDPGCFRLVRTYGIVIVKLVGGGEYLIPFEDDMYFENIPDNTGTVGLVFYEYAALNGACTAGLTPYQEVASGYDNEKFNGDFGYGIPPLQSVEPQMSLVKSDNPDPITVGNIITYTLLYTNPDQYSDGQGGFVPAVTVGNPDLGTPLVVNDTIPEDTCYVAGSADDNAPASEYAILYSTDNGTTWSVTEPGDTAPADGCNDTTDIQWWRLTELPANTSDSVTFAVTVPASYAPPVVPNTGCLSFGNSACFLDDDETTLVSGTLSISGTVFCDDGTQTSSSGPCSTGTAASTLANSVLDAGGGEPGMPNVHVELYYDVNGNGDVDSGDSLLASTDTNASGAYFFTSLPAGDYIVKVIKSDTDVQSTYGITTPETRDVTLVATNVSGLDFGFAPPLSLEKSVNKTTGIGGDLFTYTLTLNNNLPGNGTAGGACTYYVWTGQVNQTGGTPPGGGPVNSQWQDASNAAGRPDGQVAYTNMLNNDDIIGLTGFNIADMGGSIISVGYRLYVNEKLDLDDDQLDVVIYDGAGGVETDSYFYNTTFTGPTGANYVIDGTITYTPVGGWQFSQFSSASNQFGLQLTGNRIGGTSGDLELDAAAFVITTSETCSGASSTLNPVPLTDVFRNDHFAFVSASPPISGSSVSGTDTTLLWGNLGPIYPGGTKEVTISLRSLDPGATINSTDTATSTNSKFADGKIANTPVSDQATVTITDNTSTRSVSGILFDDNNANGWQGGAWTVGGAQVGYDAGDTFIQNAVVDLYGCFDRTTGILVSNAGTNTTCAGANGGWQLTGRTYTDVGGSYSFTSLGQGYYYILVNSAASIAGAQTADVNQAGVCTTCDSRSNDPSGNGGAEDLEDTAFVVDLDDNTAVTRVNFGYNVPSGTASTIGDLIYFDWDGDGAFTAGVDEGIDGVTVELLNPADTVVSTQSTVDGAYLFTGLSAGVYTVRVSSAALPSYVTQTVDPDETGVCTICDNRSVSTVNGTNSDLTRDFGYYPYGTGQIGDTVWRDKNADGTQLGFLETGIPSITVSLQADFNNDGTWVTIATDVTDSNGNYLFENLPDGTYRVVVDSVDTDLPDDAFGQDYDPTTDTTLTVVMSGGVVTSIDGSACTTCDLDSDFGFGPLGVIGDTIFWDANADGEQDYTEDGVPGVTVTLYADVNENGAYDSGTDTFVASDVTDSDGKYLFTGIPTDADGEKYVVVVTATSGPLAGRTLTADPNADGLPCTTTPEPWSGFYADCDSEVASTIYPGTAYMGADFGYLPGAVIGDTVWIDSDGDGIRDGTETGIGFVTVRLCSDAACATVVDTTETDADGNYYFTEVPNGTYFVVVDTADGDFPSGVTATYNDSDDTTVNNVTRAVVSGGNVTEVGDDADPACTNCGLTVDFGYRYVGANDLSGTVCLENSSVNGICGAGVSGVGANESAFNNVNIYLYVWTDDGDSIVESGETVQVGSTQTDSNGDYVFTNIANANYVIAIGAPQSNLYLTTTQPLVGAPTTQVVEAVDTNGYAVSAYQAITVSGDVDNRDFAFETDPKDYGDLPVTYSTLINNSPSGPSHTVPTTPNLYLGSTAPDTETNGSPNATATGDGSDEDGVATVGVWGNGSYNAVNGTGGAINVTVNGSGYLMGWIDFNRDGDFTDSGELIISQSVTTGSANYTFDIPANTFAGPSDPADLTLYARFRVFESQPLFPSLAYAGAAGDGEVEDYAFNWAMEIDKDTSMASVIAGGQATYTIVLTNAGNQTLTNVSLTDTLPASSPTWSWTYASISHTESGAGTSFTTDECVDGQNLPDPVDGDTNTIECGRWSIGVGGSVTIIVTVDVDVNTPDGTYDNTASASSEQTGSIDDDGTAAQDADTPSGSDPENDEDVSIGSIGTLVIVKDSIPDNAQDFAYTVTGTGLTPFTLDDDAGADATYLNSQTFNNLAAGGTYAVTETAVAGWSVTNISCTGATSSTVTVGAAGGFDAGDTDVSVVLAAGETVTCTFENTAVLSVVTTKTADDTSIPETGQSVTYTVEVENTSLVDVTLDSLTDDFFNDITTTGHDNVTATTCAAGGTIAAGTIYSCTFTATVSGDFPGTHVNIVTAQVSNGSNTTSDDDDETVTFEDVLPAITVTKTANPITIPETGGSVTFTYQVQNTGTVPVTITSLDDDIFGALTGDADCQVGTILAPNATCDFTATQNLSGTTGTTHTNVFTAHAEDDDANDASDTDDAVVTFTDVLPAITVTKTANPITVPETGSSVTFTYQVQNTGTVPVTLTLLNDDIFGALTGDADCQVGTVLASNATCDFTTNQNLSGAAGTTHTNVFTAEADDDDGNTATDDDDAVVTFTDVLPVIVVTKTANPTSVLETGGNVTFTYTVENTGMVNVTITSLDDDIFGALTGDADCQVGTVLVETSTCDFTTTQNLSGAAGTTHTNVFTAEAGDDDGNTATDDDDAVVTFTAIVLPEITVTKTANPVSVPETGGNVTFTYEVQNTGTIPVTITSLDDDIFGALTGDADCQVGTVLASNETCDFTTTQNLSGATGTTHTNVFTAHAEDSSSTDTSDTDDAVVTFTDVLPVIVVTKTANPTSVPETGGSVTFTYTVENTGTVPVTISLLDDDIFGALAGDADCQVGTVLSPSATCDFTTNQNLSGAAGTTHTNVFTAEADDDDGNTTTDDDDAVVTFTDVLPAITVTKTANPTSVPETGGSVTFTYQVQNTGAVNVTITSLDDDIFGALTGDADCQAGTVLAPNATCDFTANQNLSGAAGTTHTNVFTAHAEDDDANDTSETDDAVVTFTPVYATLGDFVWNDINGDGVQDGGAETGIAGVTVYVDIDSSGTLNAGDLSDVTDGAGAYSITNIPPGTYDVIVNNPPAGYNATYDLDGGNDDQTSVTLGAGQTLNTVDFGYQTTASSDLELDKSVSNAAPLVTTNIDFTITVTNQGPDTATNVVVTDALPSGFTYVSDSATQGAYNDATGIWNVGTLTLNQTETLIITVTVNITGPYTNDAEITGSDQVDPDSIPNNSSTNEDDDDSVTVNPTQNNPVLNKSLSGSNQAFTANPEVAIGEIVEYTVTIEIPPGVFANAEMVDTMERGLSFVSCTSITPGDPALTTDVAGSFATACSTPTVDDAGGSTTVDIGRRVTFDLGTLTNASGADQDLTFVYTAVVLDNAGNVSGVDLSNDASWSSNGTSTPLGSANVRVAEPDLSISKTANTTLVSVGSEITITLTIQHTADSETNAYDTLVTDTLPAELEYVPGTLECASGAQDADALCNYDAGTRTVSATWSNFTLNGGNGKVTFRVRIASLPSAGIRNVANVAWTSLPGNVSTPQNSNVFSTERDYDPASQIDVYGTSDTLVLGVFNSTPATGFAPNVVTDLSDKQPVVYTQTGGLTVEIPSLGINIPIVGVPLKNGGWDVSWLGNQAGWLEGSAFPSWSGNSVLTSHVYGSNGLPGPFVNLNKLKYGDKIVIHAYGQKYTFEVRINQVVEPNDASIFKHEEKSWLTLVTCKEYDAGTNTYKKRVVVRAVLIGVER